MTESARVASETVEEGVGGVGARKQEGSGAGFDTWVSKYLRYLRHRYRRRPHNRIHYRPPFELETVQQVEQNAQNTATF